MILDMLFNKKFEIIELHEKDGITITHYLKGTQKDLDEEIEEYKKICSRYKKVGKNGMIIWVE